MAAGDQKQHSPRDVIACADATPAMMAPPFPDHLGYFIADAVLKALEEAGYRICPPGTLLLPQSRQEAEVMNLVSEKYLSPN